MPRPARQNAIMQELAERGACSVADLSQRFGVSTETIRRDIKEMAVDGLLRRVHGGATLPSPLREASFDQRMREHAEAKQAIARLAAGQVRNGDTLMFDTGTTTAYVARALTDHRDLLVVTNSLEIARTLAGRNGNRVFMAGGEVSPDGGAALGPSASAFVGRFRVRTAFLSVGAVDPEGGLMVYDLAEADYSRAVLESAERTVVVADRSKLNRRALVKVCDLGDIDALITDLPPPPPMAERLELAGVAMLVAA